MKMERREFRLARGSVELEYIRNSVFPYAWLIHSPSNEKAGGPILKLLFDSSSGAGIAAKFPFPSISKLSLTGSPKETRSILVIVRAVKFTNRTMEGVRAIDHGQFSYFERL